MFRIPRSLLFAHVVVFAVLGVFLWRACAAPAAGRSVSLSDATAAPTYLVYLWPGGTVTYADRHGENCPSGGYFSDVQAYHWNGSALPYGQRWSARLGVQYWRNEHRRLVTFDGVTFANRTRASVLVAAWCE
jgi:hypothetical protein